ncbi:unnamed protein product [Paramecium sonneborni]|uniref:Uncharacterized protein n=1 Tax=Paramecium sonneborni TaxID=65129 RepID=A0A8S1RRV2_9CILI|nr:unnamed protein product [Paramecium sonneborni]
MQYQKWIQIECQLSPFRVQFTWKTNSIIELELQDFLGDIDPFRKENNIITPNLYRILNTTIVDKPIPLFSSENKPFKISISDGTIVLNHDYTGNDDRQEMTQLLLVLESCSNLTAVPGSYCADENVIQQYLSKLHGFLFLTIKLNQLKQSTGQLEEIEKQYYTAFDTSRPLYSQVMLKQQESIIDDGILFNSYENYYFLNNYELIHQQVEYLFTSQVVSLMSKHNYQFRSFGCYLFRIDNISVQEIITSIIKIVKNQIDQLLSLLILQIQKMIMPYWNFQRCYKNNLEVDIQLYLNIVQQNNFQS